MNHFIILRTNKHKINPSLPAIALNGQWTLFAKGPFLSYAKEHKRVIVLGDYIGTEEELMHTQDNDIPKLRGHFHAIVITPETIKVYSSFLNILPIYIMADKQAIASSMALLEKTGDHDYTVDKKYILENLLFNYSFFNRTKYKEVQLLPCNHFIAIKKGNVAIEKHFDITGLFTQNCARGKQKAHELSDLFLETVQHYFPNEPFDIAFTSGFDGRTLVSCATYFKKEFATFSFGRPENDDVSIPENNAKELNIPYRYFNLGAKEYVEDAFLPNALEFASSGYLGNGLIYAHFPYSAKKVGQRSNYLLSGACGSELFRALHATGAVTSVALAEVFKRTDPLEIAKILTHAKVLEVLKKEEFANDLNELVAEIIDYKNQLPQEISPNQQFYVFVFEEIFRKFFGQWIAVQQEHIKVRTPFLDFTFVAKLLQTHYAGANNDFFTGNPFKRIKGQYIYADIIRKTNTTIYNQVTGKGYRPKDVRNLWHKGNIVLPFIKKKLGKKVSKPYLDNLGIISGVHKNKAVIKDIVLSASLFNKSVLIAMLNDLSPHTPEQRRDTLLMAVSLIYNLQKKTVAQAFAHAGSI